MLRVISFNLNGIRSAARKGFFEWLQTQNADVVCLQELKAQEADLTDTIFQPSGYTGYFHYAEKKGYSGVGIYTRYVPKNVITGLGWMEADSEGRYIELDFGKLNIASLYMPSGTSGEARQAIKYDFLARYQAHLAPRVARDSLIICGDWNIAHRQIDLKNWRSNQKNSGFLPEERAWMDHLFDHLGFVDAFRVKNSQPEQYTWWSHRGQARANNVGWRIDYQVITPDLAGRVTAVRIFPTPLFSDHAPLLVEYDVNL